MKRWSVLLLVVVLSGCSQQFDRFEVTYTNETADTLQLDLALVHDEFDKDDTLALRRGLSLGPGETFVEEWRVEIGSYNVTISGAPSGTVDERLSVCAMGDVDLKVNETRVLWEYSRGDGWAGC